MAVRSLCWDNFPPENRISEPSGVRAGLVDRRRPRARQERRQKRRQGVQRRPKNFARPHRTFLCI
eukprot:1640723-Pyramimonas_sp.AAC.1